MKEAKDGTYRPSRPSPPSRPSRIFFTSDTHFGHSNIIRFCKRPFSNVIEMDETLIRNWNAVVAPGDEVWHCGDFAMGCSLDYAQSIMQRLNGRKHLIIGNHDNLALALAGAGGYWESVQHYKELEVEGQRIVLFHYPLRTWHHSYRGVWHFFGHVHSEYDAQQHGKSLDIGMDSQQFFPRSMEYLKPIMDKLPNAHEIKPENRWDKREGREGREGGC